MTCNSSNIKKFLAYAKICYSNMSLDYVNAVNYGECGKDLMNKILLLKSYIKEIEKYVFASCKDFVLNGEKNIGCEKIIMSKNNSLYLQSKGGKVKFNSNDLNCLTEDEICELGGRIKKICINC